MRDALYRWRSLRRYQGQRNFLEIMVNDCTRKGNYGVAKLFLDDLQRLRDQRYQEVQEEVAAGIPWVGKGRK